MLDYRRGSIYLLFTFKEFKIGVGPILAGLPAKYATGRSIIVDYGRLAIVTGGRRGSIEYESFELHPRTWLV